MINNRLSGLLSYCKKRQFIHHHLILAFKGNALLEFKLLLCKRSFLTLTYACNAFLAMVDSVSCLFPSSQVSKQDSVKMLLL